MSILTHGSDIGLAPTITPIVRQSGGTVQAALDAISRAGFESVQLDGTLAGIRPRELDQRARKDLLALLGRRSMRLAGIDLFLPRKHYTSPQHVDRAMSATLGAIQLAADLGRVPLSLALPVKSLSDDTKSAMVSAADGCGVRLAIHAEDQIDALMSWLTAVDLPLLGAAVDPAALLSRARDPFDVVQKLGHRLAVARLSDASGTDESGDEDDATAAGVRANPGAGDLDVAQYRVAVDLAKGRSGPVVLDLRGLANPLGAAAAAKNVWEKAGFTV